LKEKGRFPFLGKRGRWKKKKGLVFLLEHMKRKEGSAVSGKKKRRWLKKIQLQGRGTSYLFSFQTERGGGGYL